MLKSNGKKCDPFKDSRYDIPPHPSYVSHNGEWGYWVIEENGDWKFCADPSLSEEGKKLEQEVFKILFEDMDYEEK